MQERRNSSASALELPIDIHISGPIVREAEICLS